MENKENIKIYLSKLTLSKKEIVRLNVDISGSPSVGEILGIMNKINEVTDAIKEDYISVTDLSKLDVNNFFRSIIIYGMEKTYKSFLSVKHKAKISFVILKEDDQSSNILKGSLKDINIIDTDYLYKYVFISNLAQVKPMTEKILFDIAL